MDLNNTAIHSAVLVIHDVATDSIVFTKRSEHLRNHPGEISFPGGLWEERDKTLYDTGLRELYEELGISAERVNLIKQLNKEKTLLGVIIHPWFVKVNSVHPYVLNAEEVASLLLVPRSLVIDPSNYRETIITRGRINVKTLEFIPKDGIIWGATARIMKQLVTLLE